MAFTHAKKVYIESFIKARSGSGPRHPDLDPTKMVRIRPDPDPQPCLPPIMVYSSVTGSGTVCVYYHSIDTPWPQVSLPVVIFTLL
jgi:hypothetical protein